MKASRLRVLFPKKIPLLGILLTIAFLFALVFALFPNNDTVNITNEISRPYNEDWLLESENRIISLPTTVPIHAGESVTISKTITDVFENGAMSIAFMSSLQSVEIRVDNEVIYQYNLNPDRYMDVQPPPAWHLVRLNSQMLGKTLSITYSSEIPGYGGVLNSIETGSKLANLSAFVMPKMLGLAICFTIFVLGILLILIYLFMRKGMPQLSGFLHLGLFAILIALWSACETRLLQLCTGNVQLIMVVTFLSIMLAPIPLLLYFRSGFFGKIRKIYNVLIGIDASYFLIMVTLQALSLCNFNVFFFLFLGILMVSLLITTVTTARRYFQNKNIDNKISVVAILFLTFFAILDFLRYWLGQLFLTSSSDSTFFTRLGILLFILSLGYLTFKKMLGYYSDSVKVAAYKVLATMDSLSGLYNRSYFAEACKPLFADCKNEGRSFSLILVDIDNFKNYNDNYGHLPGDAVIKSVSAILKTCIHQPADAVIRYGGEEFLIVLPGTDLQGAQNVAQDVQTLLAEAKIIHDYSSANHYVTVSQGIYSAVPTKTDTLEHFTDLADKALYRAKAEGKDRYVCYLAEKK